MRRTADLDAPVSDNVWLVRFANGDPEAAQVLTARLAPRAYKFALRMLGNQADAEDVAQEAMLRLWKHAPSWRQDGPAMPSTWVLRVVRNLCIDRLRQAGGAQRSGTPVEELDQLPSQAPSVETALMQKDRKKALQNALSNLPVRQKEAVVLRHLEGLGNPEIAQIMDISVEAVESLLARGKRALSAQLSERASELGFADDTGS